MPKAVGLDGIHLKELTLPNIGDKELQLFYGTFFTYHFTGSELRIRGLNRLINKKDKSGEFLFSKFLLERDLLSFSGTTLGDFAEFTGFKLVFWAGSRYTNSTARAADIEADISVKSIHFLVPAAYRNSLHSDFKIDQLPKLSFIYQAGVVESIVNIHNPNLHKIPVKMI